MKEEQILKHKRIVLETFIFLLTTFVLILLYKSKHPYSLPGIEGRAQFVIAVIGIFVLLLYMPSVRTGAVLEVISQKFKELSVKELPFEHISQLFKDISINFKKAEENQAGYFRKAVGIVFQVLLVIFLFSLLIQQVISDLPINLDYLLVAIIVFGIVHILSNEEKVKKEPVGGKDYIFASIMGISGSIIVWYKIQGLGALSYIFSIISGILIILLSILILKEE